MKSVRDLIVVASAAQKKVHVVLFDAFHLHATALMCEGIEAYSFGACLSCLLLHGNFSRPVLGAPTKTKTGAKRISLNV